MKKELLITLLILFVSTLTTAQTEEWKMQNYCVGLSLPNDTPNSYVMADVHMLPDSSYIMYYTVPFNFGEKLCIKYATSTDAINWTPQDTCFCGSADTTARNYVVGGADLIFETDGTYRMYYRCTEKTNPPNYHIRSAVSSDGITWTQEGITIEIEQYGGTPDLVLAGHGTFYINETGEYSCVFGGNFGSDPGGQNGASDLKTAQSVDGLVWTNFQTLYVDAHDPIVLERNGTYYMYAMYLDKYMIKAISPDGITWSPSADSTSFLDVTDAPMIINGTKKIGDVGGIVMPDGEIYLYTNFGTTTGPSTDIVRYELQNPGVGISDEVISSTSFSIYPNPASNQISFQLNNESFSSGEIIYAEIYDFTGKVISKTEIENGSSIQNIDISELPNGTYFIKLIGSESGYIDSGNKFIVLK